MLICVLKQPEKKHSQAPVLGGLLVISKIGFKTLADAGRTLEVLNGRVVAYEYLDEGRIDEIGRRTKRALVGR